MTIQMEVTLDARNTLTLHQWPRTAISDLYKEIQLGETKLFHTPEGRLLRKINVVKISITYKGKIMVEEYQFYPRTKSRHMRPHAWISEKVQEIDRLAYPDRPGRALLQCCKRALKEEIGVELKNASRFDYLSTATDCGESYRYHGMLNETTLSSYKLELSKDEYNELGYWETILDPTGEIFRYTKFGWRTNYPPIVDSFIYNRSHFNKKDYLPPCKSFVSNKTKFNQIIVKRKILGN
jgi:hypothetical protein